MDWFTSPGVCTCAITRRMHAVCDEHGSHSFKSNGLPAHRPWIHEVMSTRRQKISGQNSEVISIRIHVVFLHAHGVDTVHGVPCPFGSFLSDQWRQPDFEDRKRVRQKLPSLMAEDGNTCTTCTYCSSTPAFFAPFYYCQCLCPYGQRCSDTNDGSFEQRVVSAYNVYLHILCMIEPGKGMRFSSSVKHLHNMHLSAPSPQIQIWTTNMLDGVLMVAQRKGA